VSRSARLTLFFFEGDFDFQLRIGELVQLEELRLQQLKRLFPALDPAEVSIGRLYERLAGGRALIDDIRHTLRLARIGAGAPKEEAHDLVERHLQGGNILECSKIALAVLGVAMVGNPEDPPGDVPKGEEKGRGTPRTAAPRSRAAKSRSAGAKSTATARRSAGPRARSTS
jgi:hypothetical protein